MIKLLQIQAAAVWFGNEKITKTRLTGETSLPEKSFDGEKKFFGANL
jgi:hypothetical protein